jgi:replication-associated recombination protein RarA
MTSKHGYKLDEVVSALQKSARRGDSDGALFWAWELNVSGYGAWAWRRLFTICSEDVGLAEPTAPAVISALWTMSEVLRANQPKPVPGEKAQFPPLQLLQAVWILARSAHNREIPDCLDVLHVRSQRGQFPEVPDAALDKHTGRGRAMGRGARHFEDESEAGGRFIANPVEVDGNVWNQRFHEEWAPPDELRAPEPASPSDAGSPDDGERQGGLGL